MNIKRLVDSLLEDDSDVRAKREATAHEWSRQPKVASAKYDNSTGLITIEFSEDVSHQYIGSLFQRVDSLMNARVRGGSFKARMNSFVGKLPAKGRKATVRFYDVEGDEDER